MLRGLAFVATIGVLSCALAPGCLSPTQAIVDASLVGARCGEIHGTAITVGTEPSQTELRVRDHYVNATTGECDATGHIGTLVITPNDDNAAAAVVVVAAYGDVRDPSTCLPPAYASCIVARRRFTFIDHKTLHLPIAIDPDCANVPCNAFSTCNKGKCVDSTIECESGACTEPGQRSDGGARDGGPDPVVPGQARCDGRTLRCWSGGSEVACTAPQECCAPQGEAMCMGPGACGSARYCCADSDCPSGRCMQPGDVGGSLLSDAMPPAEEDGGTVPLPDAGPAPTNDAGSTADAGGPRIGLGFCVQ